jgi:hypothetical protein
MKYVKIWISLCFSELAEISQDHVDAAVPVGTLRYEVLRMGQHFVVGHVRIKFE